MNSNEIKNAAILDLEMLVEMAIKEAEKTPGSFDENMQNRNPKTGDKKDDCTFDFIRQSGDWNFDYQMAENWNFKYDSFKFSCSILQAIHLIRPLKRISDCPKVATSKAGKPNNNNSNAFQLQISKYRRIHQLSYYGEPETGLKAKNDLIGQYKKSGQSDLIRLCWKYITNPAQIEGINCPYSEEPRAIFTPYREVQNIPEYIQNQYKIAI